jgi:hypothetical protein
VSNRDRPAVARVPTVAGDVPALFWDPKVKTKSYNATTSAAPEEMPITIDVNGLSRMLHLATGTIANRMSRGDPMPPAIRVGGKPIWLYSTVIAWLRARERAAQNQMEHSADSSPPRGRTTRGRKQKASSIIERRRQMLSALEQRSAHHNGQ